MGRSNPGCQTTLTGTAFTQNRKHPPEDRINRLLIPAFRTTRLSAFNRDMLQDFLDQLATNGTAWSIIAHLRWDCRMIFKIAVNDGLLNRNPADALYIPKAPSRVRLILTLDQASTLFNAFGVRERLILKLCGLLGLRPGEALALQWHDLNPEGFRITRRVYRGKIDTPKSTKSTRLAALSESVKEDLNEWHKVSPNTKPTDWIFPSENPKNPVWPTNVWYDKIRPTLETLGLAWVNYQVLRRSAASLMNQLGIEGKVVADQLGHGLNVSQNVYNQAGIKGQTEAVNTLDNALKPKNKTDNKKDEKTPRPKSDNAA